MGLHHGQANFVTYGKPSLFLDFANKKSLVDRISGNNLITFTRSSIGSYVGADGLIKYAAADEARFDHDPTTGESLGLLIEESRTNLAKKSGELNNTTYWTQNFGATATAAPSITAPDGSTDTWKLIVANNTGQLRFALNGNQGTFGANTYTWSVFAKAAEYSYLGISLYDGTYYRATFNLSDGTTSNTFNATPNITPYPNGWYRCSITATTIANLKNSVNYVDGFWPYATAQTAGATQTGDGISGVYVWGPQLEVGSFQTSYVTTGGGTSTVTRQPDNAQITGTNFSDWYNQSEGTIISKHYTKYDSGGYVAYFNDGNDYRIATIDYSQYQGLIIDGGVSQANIDVGAPTISATNKIGLGYKVNDIALSLNGGSIATDTNGTIPSVTKLNLGARISDNHINSSIKQLAYYPTRLTNTQLQDLTE